ncbi:hypothetical protein BDZ85DRAFT_40684 [Elsinoe ampelina]|uniref:Uncharacterized protein n=1 Tax=Elsinoe ampelina TaxID=302913 RepID=A0A6A6G2I2_9PEZI|nr:hypothetical protein BDZ85DRAFT_40684 [Elsinoe ampelina]
MDVAAKQNYRSSTKKRIVNHLAFVSFTGIAFHQQGTNIDPVMKRLRSGESYGNCKKTKTTVSSLPASTLDTPMGRSAVQTSKIFDIPPELRNQIWEYVYQKETITIVLYRNRPKQITEPTKRHLASMSLTCVLFSRETSSFFHRNITLSFRYSKTLRSFSKGISESLRQILTRLEVQEEWTRHHTDPYPTDRWVALGTVLGSFPNLEMVVIDMFGEMEFEYPRISDSVALVEALDQTRSAMDAKRALEAQLAGGRYQHPVTPSSMVVITPRPWNHFRNTPVPQADRDMWHRNEDAKHDFTIIFGADDKPVQADKRRQS